jgi:hypothetical protein
MSIGPTPPIVVSAAGAPLSQTAGAETERAQKDASAHSRQVAGERQAEQAAGIGQTAQDEQSGDRDADGRRLWERSARREGEPDGQPSHRRPAKDPTGVAGNELDLTG